MTPTLRYITDANAPCGLQYSFRLCVGGGGGGTRGP